MSCRDIPAKAAGVTQRLRLSKIGIAPHGDVLPVPELPDHLLLFSDIYRVSDTPRNFAVFKQSLTHIAHDAKSPFGVNNPKGNFKVPSSVDHFLRGRDNHLAIIWMHGRKHFSERGNPLGGIKTQTNERFGGPVIES